MYLSGIYISGNHGYQSPQHAYIALWKLILFAQDKVMTFIYTDMMLPLFFCIFIRILTTSNWNANDSISMSEVFELFHYKMLIERLFVNPHCVDPKYISYFSSAL